MKTRTETDGYGRDKRRLGGLITTNVHQYRTK